jgi:hypothetical protein
MRLILFARTRDNSTRRMFWWNLRWLPSFHEECEDCFCKLRLSLLPTDNTQGVWDRAAVVAKCHLKSLSPNLWRGSVMETRAVCAVAPSRWKKPRAISSNEGAQSHFTITFRADGVIEDYAAAYPISWYAAPHTNLLIMESCILDLMPINCPLNDAVLAVDVNRQMKPRFNGEKCDIQHILSIGSNYVSKLLAIFNTPDLVTFFQFMHWWWVLLQHSPCAAIRDSRLLCQFTNINTMNKEILSSAVQVHGDFWITLCIKVRATIRA